MFGSFVAGAVVLGWLMLPVPALTAGYVGS